MKNTVFHFILICCSALFLLLILFDSYEVPILTSLIQLFGNAIADLESPIDGIVESFEVISVFFTEGEAINIQDLLDLFTFPFVFIGRIIIVLYNILVGLVEIFS